MTENREVLCFVTKIRCFFNLNHLWNAQWTRIAGSSFKPSINYWHISGSNWRLSNSKESTNSTNELSADLIIISPKTLWIIFQRFCRN
uniref:Uncharacterized protein n=1 Tax=Aster yellows phytoplasma TaxID=35779 RepID=Q847T3_ASTYP|nr:hypothetical protein [Aster yellows phytoplasma]